RREDRGAVRGAGLAEPALQVVGVLGEGLRLGGGAAQRLGGHAVGAGGAAEAEVDAVAVDVGEGAVLLGHHQRRVVGQHDAAGADADVLGDAGGLRDEQRGGLGGEVGRVVVLGKPESVVAQLVGELRGRHRGGDAVTGGRALGDGDQVEDAQGKGQVGSPSAVEGAGGDG